jgi:hypothetical protein
VEYDFIRYRNNPDDLNSLSDNRIISLYYDKAVNPDEIYAGTYGTGLNKITFSNDNTKENTITTYTRNEGLPNDVVYSILSDDYGHLWISTNDGLANFNPKNNNFEVYDVNDGLQANQFFGEHVQRVTMVNYYLEVLTDLICSNPKKLKVIKQNPM